MKKKIPLLCCNVVSPSLGEHAELLWLDMTSLHSDLWPEHITQNIFFFFLLLFSVSLFSFMSFWDRRRSCSPVKWLSLSHPGWRWWGRRSYRGNRSRPRWPHPPHVHPSTHRPNANTLPSYKRQGTLCKLDFNVPNALKWKK